MSIYNEHNVKTKAVTMFLNIISLGNRRLGQRLNDNRDTINSKVLENVQRIGIHDYAEKVLKDRHGRRERGDLEYLIDEA